MTSNSVAQGGNRGKPEVERKPTESQKRLLTTIRRLTKKSGGVPPSLNELADELGVTTGTVKQVVWRMRQRGWILPSNGIHRNIRVA
jgi:DNA-binding MarR family transcriptional regulator